MKKNLVDFSIFPKIIVVTLLIFREKLCYSINTAKTPDGDNSYD